MSPTRTAARAIEQLAEGHSMRELEQALCLSNGYLSKLRHGRATASPHLLALLEVLCAHPEALATVRAVTGAPSAEPRPRDLRAPGSRCRRFARSSHA